MVLHLLFSYFVLLVNGLSSLEMSKEKIRSDLVSEKPFTPSMSSIISYPQMLFFPSLGMVMKFLL